MLNKKSITRTIRGFLAFPINSEVKEGLGHILNDLQQTRADVKWVQAENLHLTLKFLGDIEETDLEKISSVISESCRGFDLITSHLNEIGVFPDLCHPRIVWAGLDDSKQKFQSIVEALEERLAKLGFAKDNHPFKPHITLGRVKLSANLKNLMQTIQQITFEGKKEQTFEKIILYKSTLTPQGPVYEVLKEFDIGR
jgi:2'-5' RNA ligase